MMHCNIPETSDHYFSHCTIFSNGRLQLFRESRQLHYIQNWIQHLTI